MNLFRRRGGCPGAWRPGGNSPVRIFGEALSNYIPGLGHLINYKISRADCDFSIEKGYVRTSNFVAQGSNMSLEGEAGYAFPICRSIQISSWGFAVCRGLLLPGFPVGRRAVSSAGNGAFEQCFLEFRPFSGGKPPFLPRRLPGKGRADEIFGCCATAVREPHALQQLKITDAGYLTEDKEL